MVTKRAAFDLSFAWRRYARHAAVQRRLVDAAMRGRLSDVAQTTLPRAHGLTVVSHLHGSILQRAMITRSV
jgi:hypothetical protein